MEARRLAKGDEGNPASAAHLPQGRLLPSLAGMTPRRSGLILLFILGLAAVLRILFQREVDQDPYLADPAVDSLFHHYWARGSATGDWTPPPNHDAVDLGRTPYFRPPGYPWFLGLVYRATGPHPAAGRWANTALGLLNILLLYLLARRLFGAGAALWAAGLMAGYGVLIFFEAELMEPVLSITVLLLALLGLARVDDRPRWGLGLGTGFLLGALAVIRPNALVMAPVAAGWAGWVSYRRGGWRAAGPALLGLLLGVAAAVFPVTLRNLVRGGDRVLITSNSGINFFLGNSPYADGAFAQHPDIGEFADPFDAPDIHREVEQEEGRSLRASEVSRIFARRAWAYIREHPGAVLRLWWRKTLLFWGSVEVGNNRNLEAVREASPVLRSLPLTFPLLLALALAGGWRLLDRRPPDPGTGRAVSAAVSPREFLVLGAGCVAAYFASYLPYFVADRYRVAVLPFLFLLAGYGLAEVGRAWRAGSSRRRVVDYLLVVLALWLVLAPNYAGYRSRREVSFGRAVALRARGDLEGAYRQYQQALREDPGNPRVYINLAEILGQTGRTREAIQQLQRALEVAPGFAGHHTTYFNLGVSYAKLGEYETALQWLERARALRPAEADLVFELGYVWGLRNDLVRAEQYYRSALALQPDHAKSWNALGTLHARRNDVAAATDCFERAVRLGNLLPARLNLARVAAAQGRRTEALARLDQILAEQPGNEEARQLRDQWSRNAGP